MTTDTHHYTDTDAPAHDRAKRTIAQTLANDAHGRENAISSAALAERTPVSASTVRDLVPQVMAEYGLPVGTSNGYFVIQTDDEYDRQVERQLKQAETSRQRALLIGRTYNQSSFGGGSP